MTLKVKVRESNIYFLTLAVFLNLWTWKIFAQNIFLGAFVLIASIILFVSLTKRIKKPLTIIFSFLFLVLVFFQWKLTPFSSLTKLNNDQIRIRDMRLREYPPVYFKFGSKTIWLSTAHWLEGRKEIIAFRRIQENFFSILDINQYFFAGHPRERVGVKEIEKYPYIFLPFFIIGLITIVSEVKDKKLVYLSLVIPIMFLILWGNKSSLGPFSLFPFISTTIALGLKNAHESLKTLPKDKKAKLVIGVLLFFVLVFIQIINYESF